MHVSESHLQKKLKYIFCDKELELIFSQIGFAPMHTLLATVAAGHLLAETSAS